MNGAGGQYAIIDPLNDVVVVRLGHRRGGKGSVGLSPFVDARPVFAAMFQKRRTRQYYSVVRSSWRALLCSLFACVRSKYGSLTIAYLALQERQVQRSRHSTRRSTFCHTRFHRSTTDHQKTASCNVAMRLTTYNHTARFTAMRGKSVAGIKMQFSVGASRSSPRSSSSYPSVRICRSQRMTKCSHGVFLAVAAIISRLSSSEHE